MKVCHFTSTHREKDQRIFEKECVSLVKSGYDVYLVEQGKTEECKGVHIIGTGENNGGRYYRLFVRPRKIYKLALGINADIYHFHDMELIPYGNKLRRRGKKVIFDCHEDFASRFAESDALPGPKLIKKILQGIYTSYEKYSITRYAAVVSVTPHICKRLKKSNKNTVMITNYPIMKNHDWDELISDYDGNAEKYIAYAGQIDDTYQLRYITEAIQNITNIRMKICGSERVAGDIKNIKEADINNKVEFLGRLPYNEVPKFLSDGYMAVVLTPYIPNSAWRYGNLGTNKLFEAMYRGIPVICTDYTLFKKIIDKYYCGICVNPYDKRALIDSIKRLLNNSDEAKLMGENGRKAVLEKFNWESQEVKLLNLYSKIK